MKTTRILPAALAAALIAAGGVTHAFAAADDEDGDSLLSAPTTTIQQAAVQDHGMARNDMRTPLTMSSARLKAEDMVGGGAVIAAQRYGIGNDQYKFDIKQNGQIKRVFVNGRTGKVEVAASLDQAFDPTVIGSPNDNPREDRNDS